MNCYIHPDRAAAGFCRACGRAICTECQRAAEGTVFCPEHVPVTAQSAAGAYSSGPYATGNPAGAYAGANPYAQPQPPLASPVPVMGVQASPALAFVLGFIPGVGAIYNGQYIKGLVHAAIFGLIITLINSNGHGSAEPLFGILLSAFTFYMPFEAYHTAKRRQLGLPVEEWSSLSRGPLPMAGGRAPIGPIILIAIGVLFLLDTMNLIQFSEISRFWPVILIAVGASMLYSRMNPRRAAENHQPGMNIPPPYPAPYPAPPTAGMTSGSATGAPVVGSEFMESGRE